MCFDDCRIKHFFVSHDNTKKPAILAGKEEQMRYKLGVRFAYMQNEQKIVVFLSPEEWREVFKTPQHFFPAPLAPKSHSLEDDPILWVAQRCC